MFNNIGRPTSVTLHSLPDVTRPSALIVFSKLTLMNLYLTLAMRSTSDIFDVSYSIRREIDALLRQCSLAFNTARPRAPLIVRQLGDRRLLPSEMC